MGRVGHKNMTDHPKLLKKRKRESILPLTAIHRADGAVGSREREREHGPRSTAKNISADSSISFVHLIKRF